MSIFTEKCDNPERFECNINGHSVCLNKKDNQCDGVSDCDDNSDEFECTLLEKNMGYKKSLPPASKTEKSTKLEVKISVDIIQTEEIDEILSSVGFQYIMQLVWYDNRVRFKNLKKEMLNEVEYL